MRILLPLAALSLVASSGPALAHDHVPPRASLWADGVEVQVAEPPVTYCWTAPADRPNHYVTTCSDGITAAPDPVDVRHLAQMSIRFDSAIRPLVTIWSYPRRSAHGTHAGDAQIVPSVTVPGDGWWEARFTVPVPCRAHYLLAFGEWEDEHGFGPQDARYALSAKVGPHQVPGVPPPC